MTRLVLEIDDDLMARAQELAAARHETVEQMLQRVLRVMAQPPLTPDEMTPNLKRASGLAPPMTDEEVERVLDEERMAKYGRS